MEKLPETKKFNYKEQHAIIVIAANEAEQRQIFERLKEMGFEKLKVVSV
jgi:hypothetical protein